MSFRIRDNLSSTQRGSNLFNVVRFMSLCLCSNTIRYFSLLIPRVKQVRWVISSAHSKLFRALANLSQRDFAWREKLQAKALRGPVITDLRVTIIDRKIREAKSTNRYILLNLNLANLVRPHKHNTSPNGQLDVSTYSNRQLLHYVSSHCLKKFSVSSKSIVYFNSPSNSTYTVSRRIAPDPKSISFKVLFRKSTSKFSSLISRWTTPHL